MTKTRKTSQSYRLNDIHMEEVSGPKAETGKAVLKGRVANICVTDVHILKENSPSNLVGFFARNS